MMDGTTGSLTYSKFLVPLEVLIDTIHTPSLNFSDPSFFECWHMDHDVVSWTWTWTSRSVTVYSQTWSFKDRVIAADHIDIQNFIIRS